MNNQKTTKQGKSPSGTPIETSTPAGHEELEANWIAEKENTDTPPEQHTTKRKTQDRKPLEPEQPLNPKRS